MVDVKILSGHVETWKGDALLALMREEDCEDCENCGRRAVASPYDG
jgi:hypothetical protein